jgi:hypothetical protein
MDMTSSQQSGSDSPWHCSNIPASDPGARGRPPSGQSDSNWSSACEGDILKEHGSANMQRLGKQGVVREMLSRPGLGSFREAVSMNDHGPVVGQEAHRDAIRGAAGSSSGYLQFSPVPRSSASGHPRRRARRNRGSAPGW